MRDYAIELLTKLANSKRRLERDCNVCGQYLSAENARKDAEAFEFALQELIRPGIDDIYEK